MLTKDVNIVQWYIYIYIHTHTQKAFPKGFNPKYMRVEFYKFYATIHQRWQYFIFEMVTSCTSHSFVLCQLWHFPRMNVEIHFTYKPYMAEAYLIWNFFGPPSQLLEQINYIIQDNTFQIFAGKLCEIAIWCWWKLRLVIMLNCLFVFHAPILQSYGLHFVYTHTEICKLVNKKVYFVH